MAIILLVSAAKRNDSQGLRELGYQVLVARNAENALSTCSQIEERISLVIADLDLPDMAAPEMMEAMWRRWEGLPVIYLAPDLAMDKCLSFHHRFIVVEAPCGFGVLAELVGCFVSLERKEQIEP